MNMEKPPARCLSVLGTGSDVGKSITAAALCRIFSDMGVNVAPYKAQNMSNNSFVTELGGEMGRAQVVQAEAARVEPHVDMNPVLLKPATDTGAQVVVQGRPIGNRKAADYFKDTLPLFEIAKESLERLRAKHGLIIMEGAGSCAEMNLLKRDFVNFRMASCAEAPVILVADIDRGGVFAQIIGTMHILPEEYRKLVKGLIINRFRGDASLFADGISYIEEKTGLPVLGLVPYFRHIEIDSEDGLPLDIVIDPPTGPATGRINIAVIRVPHISNFTDFAPLIRDKAVSLHYLARPRTLSGYDLLILPGSKNVRSDLGWIRETGWDREISDFRRGQGRILGVCGGYQMLGKIIRDPHGLEGDPGDTAGLGILDAETELHPEKTLTRNKGLWITSGQTVDGYEIHHGKTLATGEQSPVIRVIFKNAAPADEMDGHTSPDGLVAGTYLHGLFDLPGFRQSFLNGLRPELSDNLKSLDSAASEIFRQSQYDLLAQHYRDHLNMEKLSEIVGLG